VTTTTQKQHTVTKGVLRKFTDPSSRRLESFDLLYDRPWLKFPSEVGYVLNFVASDPLAAEEKWRRSEDRVPAIVGALEDRTLLDRADLVELSKELIALHAVRSITRVRIHEHVARSSRGHLIESLMREPRRLAASFRARTGLYAEGAPLPRRVAGALIAQAEWEADRAMEEIGEAAFFQERVMINYDELVALLDQASVQVVEAQDGAGQFLISDDPAPSMKVGEIGLGPLGGIPYPEATTIGLPVTPSHVIALADSPSWEIADAGAVSFLNRVQLSIADRRVFYRPDSGLRDSAHRAIEARNKRPRWRGPHLIDSDG
jgi:hypothetical protein